MNSSEHRYVFNNLIFITEVALLFYTLIIKNKSELSVALLLMLIICLMDSFGYIKSKLVFPSDVALKVINTVLQTLVTISLVVEFVAIF